MSAFDLLKEHYEKNMGNLGAGRALFREENAKRKVEAEDGDMNYGIERAEGVSDAAERTREDHARALEELEDAIKRSRDDREIQKSFYGTLDDLFLAKVGRPAEDKSPYLVQDRGYTSPNQKVAEASRRAWGILRSRGYTIEDLRERLKSQWRAGMGARAIGTKLNDMHRAIVERLLNPKRGGRKAATVQAMQKMSPELSTLLSAAAGWALSADLSNKGVPPEMAREWERAVSREDKKRLQAEMMRRLRRAVRKSENSESLMDELQMFYKDHAPVPHRYGLMWDAVKHRWTRPEKVGRTVWEVQGKKRLRGSGTGVHERSIARRGAGGKGTGSMEAGRRFRGIADSGRAHPHESKYPGHVTVRRAKKTQTKRKAR